MLDKLTEPKETCRISAAVARAEALLVALSAASLVVIMVVVVADVTMRYVMRSPLGWSYDLIGTYLMVCVFFFALSDTLHHHGHIAIDVFSYTIPRRFLHLSLAVGFGLSAVLVAMIAWQGWYRTAGAINANNLISATIPWPTWPSYFLVVVGSALLTLRLLMRTATHFASFVTGRELADLPPAPVNASSQAEEGAV